MKYKNTIYFHNDEILIIKSLFVHLFIFGFKTINKLKIGPIIFGFKKYLYKLE